MLYTNALLELNINKEVIYFYVIFGNGMWAYMWNVGSEGISERYTRYICAKEAGCLLLLATVVGKSRTKLLAALNFWTLMNTQEKLYN